MIVYWMTHTEKGFYKVSCITVYEKLNLIFYSHKEEQTEVSIVGLEAHGLLCII